MVRFSVQVVLPEQCIGCGSCAAVCQMGAISFSDAGVESPDVYRIVDILHSFDCPFFVENSDHFYTDPEGTPEMFQNIVRGMKQRYIGKYRPLSELPPKISKMTGYPSDKTCLPELIGALSPWFDVILQRHRRRADHP